MLFLRNNNLNLKFTGHLSDTFVPFSVVVLSNREGRIVSSLYRKPLSGNTLLRVDSRHPGHVTQGIPVGQFLRVRRICSEEGDFQQERDRMYSRFLDRGHQLNTIKRAIEIAESTSRERLLRDKRRELTSLRTQSFLDSYSLEYKKIKKILQRYVPILYEDECHAKILSGGIKSMLR